jgi:hypothetical protein
MVSISFAKNYAYAYWGCVATLLAFIIPLDPTIVGSASVLGKVMHMFPPMDTGSIWLAHCWGMVHLSMFAGNYLTPDSDLSLVRTLGILSLGWYPACAYAFWYDFGFFWKIFFPFIHTWNTYVFVSAGFFGPESVPSTKKKE